MKALTIPVFTSSTGACDNFALEVHLKFIYSQIESTDASAPIGFKITKIVADIVYGKFTPAATDTPVAIVRKTSMKFIQNEKARHNSGEPGYIKGMQIKTANIKNPTDATKPAYMLESKNGFTFLGADNTGKCYSVKKNYLI